MSLPMDAIIGLSVAAGVVVLLGSTSYFFGKTGSNHDVSDVTVDFKKKN
jgi:hypothetical protein